MGCECGRTHQYELRQHKQPPILGLPLSSDLPLASSLASMSFVQAIEENFPRVEKWFLDKFMEVILL